MFAALTVAALLPRIVGLLQLGLSLISWPWQFDYDEGINLNATLALAAGRNIYRHNGPDSFLSAPYPPLFYILNAPFAPLTGPSFALGRAASLLSTLVIAALLVYVVQRVTARLSAGLISGALWLALSPVVVWSALYKQDMLALALGLGGLAWTLAKADRRAVYAAAPLFALAFFTKQSAVSAAAAATLWLIIRHPGRGTRFALTLAGLVGVPFLAANLLLKNGLWEHLVGNHVLPWSGGRLRQAMRRLAGEHWPLVLLGGATLAGMLGTGLSPLRRAAVRAGAAGPWGLAGLYAGVGIAATLAQSGYEGANYNHLLDGLLPLCMLAGLCAGWLLCRLEAGSRRARVNAAAGLAALSVLLLAQLFAFNDPRVWYRGGTWPSPERDAEMRALSGLVAVAPGDIYSEDAYLALRNNRPLPYDDPSTFVPLAGIGGWDSSGLTQGLRDRRFGLVLLMRGSQRWTPEGLRAFEDNYTLKFPGSLNTYEPRAVPDSAQYALKCSLTGSGDQVALEGYSLAPGAAQRGLHAGETVRAALYWRADKPPAHSYASYLHIVNERGEKVAGRDNPATGASQPTMAWQAGALVVDVTAVPLPANLRPGKYRLVAGMYRTEGGGLSALRAECEHGEPYGDAISLGWVEVK